MRVALEASGAMNRATEHRSIGAREGRRQSPPFRIMIRPGAESIGYRSS
jgi:hypothetical protein